LDADPRGEEDIQMKKSVSRTLTAMLAALAFGTANAAAQQEAAKEHDNKTYIEKPGDVSSVTGVLTQPKGWFQIPMPPVENWRPNTFMQSITPEAKLKAAQSAMFVNPMDLRGMINMMVAKKKVAEGITFDEVIESMDLRANTLNMMKVSHNTPYKVIAGITGKPSPRMEIIGYCDVLTMREIVDFAPEFIAFLPCRIAVLEDADGQIWIVTLDWDVRWLDTSLNPNKISAGLRDRAIKVREAIESIMEAGANGDL
jgi:uncharacterized protein (DUF302 family)